MVAFSLFSKRLKSCYILVLYIVFLIVSRYPVLVVPKKKSMIVVKNNKDEFVLTKVVTK